MTRLFFSIFMGLFSFLAFSQTTFEKTMTEKITKLDATNVGDDYTALSNDFVRIGDKEKNQWLPYYYAALAIINKGRMEMMHGKMENLDAYADDAQNKLDKAIAISGENAETLIATKMIHSLRLMVNPMERFRTEGALAAEALAKAEKLDPENPRITLLKGEDTYFTPEQFGGSKEKGMELFKKSLEQFSKYQPKSSIDPNWGKVEAEFMASNKL